MFAVVRTGGKQYRVAAGDKIAVEKLAGDAGDRVQLGDVLLAGNGDALEDAAKVVVAAEIIAQAKSEKVLVFKKRRRHNYRRKNGHRQQMTLLRILSVGDSKAEQKTAAPQTAKVETPAPTPQADDTVETAAAVSDAPVIDTSAEVAAPKAKKAAPKKVAATEAGGEPQAKTSAKKAPADKPAEQN